MVHGVLPMILVLWATASSARAKGDPFWVWKSSGGGAGVLERVQACPNGTKPEELRSILGRLCSPVDYVTSCPRGYVWPKAAEAAGLCARRIAGADDLAESERNFEDARKRGLAPVDERGEPVFPRIMRPGEDGAYVRARGCPGATVPVLSNMPKLGDMDCLDPKDYAERAEKAKEDCEPSENNPNGYCLKAYKPSEWSDAPSPPRPPSEEDCLRQASRTQTMDPACLRRNP